MLYEVIIDAGETANKCTIAPLAYRPDFRLFHVKGPGKFGPLTAPFLLHPDGKCLTDLRSALPDPQGIAAIDCVWRRLDILVKRIEGVVPVLARIPEGFESAYPRKSLKDFDPDAGLATIEAIFVASAVLGKWDASLLSEYYFGRKFVEMNAKRFLELGVHQAGEEKCLPLYSEKARNSEQRRRDRGRGA